MKDNLLFNSLKYLFSELKLNSKNLITQAKYQMKQQTLRTSLGIGWILFRDLVFFGVFIMFRLLISGAGNISGMHLVLYLLTGMIPWNVMSQCINGSVRSIKANKNILSSIKMSVITLPIIDVIAVFFNRAFTFLILIGVVAYFGDIKDVTWWMLIFYCIMMFIYMIVWNLLFSSLIAISNDFDQLYSAVISILMFTVPIIWSFEMVQDYQWIVTLIKMNPFVYIVLGFRDACVTGALPELGYTAYFIGINALLLCVGAILQYKLRSHYIDLI